MYVVGMTWQLITDRANAKSFWMEPINSEEVEGEDEDDSLSAETGTSMLVIP